MKKHLLVLLAMLGASAAFAKGELDKARLHGTTDKERAIDYAPGETMTFTIRLEGADPFPEGAYFINWKRTGDDGKTENGRVPLSATEPLVIKTSLDAPGFVRIEANVVDAKGATYRKSFRGDRSTPEGREALNRFERADKRVFFDGGAAVQPEKLQSVPEPEDFDAFWDARKKRLAEVPMTAEVKEYPSKDPQVKVYSFKVACAGPRPVTGHFTKPAAPGKYPAEISFHGYGSHFIEKVPTSGPRGTISMFINAHGYELGREEKYYTEFYNSIKSNNKTFGLDKFQNSSKETAYFGWMTYRIMRALQYLKSMPEWDGKTLVARGGSMGGLQTIWACSLDPDVTDARPGIPWCCDMGGRETMKRNGITWGVEETPVMRYFDPVNLAKRVPKTCKVTITRAGLGDYCCPPSGIAILWNNLSCPKEILWVQGSTHGYVPPQPNQQFTLSEPAR